jgi:hypothetical protein
MPIVVVVFLEVGAVIRAPDAGAPSRPVIAVASSEGVAVAVAVAVAAIGAACYAVAAMPSAPRIAAAWTVASWS